jgi:hypothetical protein
MPTPHSVPDRCPPVLRATRRPAPAWHLLAAGLLAIGLMLTLWPVQAQPQQTQHGQWVWRDASGRLTASDRPPPREVAERDIIGRPGQPQAVPSPAARTAVTNYAAAGRGGDAEPEAATGAAPVAGTAAGEGAPAAAPTGLEREVEARRRMAEQEAASRRRTEEARLAEAQAENCRRARGHAAALEGGQRIARTNERGEREILDDRGRAEELRRTRAVIASDCR